MCQSQHCVHGFSFRCRRPGPFVLNRFSYALTPLRASHACRASAGQALLSSLTTACAVRLCAFIHRFIHSLIHSLIHSFIDFQSYFHAFIHSFSIYFTFIHYPLFIHLKRHLILSFFRSFFLFVVVLVLTSLRFFLD